MTRAWSTRSSRRGGKGRAAGRRGEGLGKGLGWPGGRGVVRGPGDTGEPPGNLEDLVIVYDVADDRRRDRVHKVLLDYGAPVQYSVFEARLTREDQVRLQIALERLLDGEEDSLVFYHQCARCRERAVRLGTAGDPFPTGLRIV